MGTTSPNHRRTRRLVLAGLLGAAALTGGAGAAYAAGTDDRAVESGYAVVVTDECPDGAAEDTGVEIRIDEGSF